MYDFTKFVLRTLCHIRVEAYTMSMCNNYNETFIPTINFRGIKLS